MANDAMKAEIDRLTFALSDARMEIATREATIAELVKALEGLADECDRIGNALSKQGIGATVLGMRVRAARATIEKARQP